MTNKYKKISFLVVALFLISSCDNAGNAGIDLTDVKDNQEKILKKLDAIEKNQLGIKSSIGAISKPAPNNKKQQPQADPNKVYDIAIGDSYTIGNKNAPITIIEWTDFQ